MGSRALGPGLVVIPMEVVAQRLHRGDATEASMGALRVVVDDPGREGIEALDVRAVEPAICPASALVSVPSRALVSTPAASGFYRVDASEPCTRRPQRQ